MKKFLILLVTMVLTGCLIASGQQDTTNVAPPSTWVDVVSNFNVWFATLSGIAAVTVFIASALVKIFKVTKGVWKQVIAWGVSIALVVAGNLFNIGFSAEFPWVTTLVYGFAAGLVANGLFDINMVQAFLEFLKLKKVKTPPPANPV